MRKSFRPWSGMVSSVICVIVLSSITAGWSESGFWDLNSLINESLKAVREFYDFVVTDWGGKGEEEFAEMMPWIFDTRLEPKTYLTWFQLCLIKKVLVSKGPSSPKSKKPDHPLKSWDVFVGFAPDQYPMNSAGIREVYVILQSPLEIGQGSESTLGYKQVFLKTVHHPRGRPLISRGRISVNGIMLFDDLWSEYWIEKFPHCSYLWIDLWTRFGISVPWEFPVRPFPAERFRVVAGTRAPSSKSGADNEGSTPEEEGQEGVKQWLKSVMRSLIPSWRRRECYADEGPGKDLERAISHAKGVLSIFYEELLNDRPSGECQNIFVSGSGGTMLKEFEVEKTWAWLREHRWLFVDPTLLTNRWRTASEVMSEFVEAPSVVAFKIPLCLPKIASQEFFVIYELDPPQPPNEPLWLNCDPKTVRQVWFPIVRTSAGYRIAVNSILVNGFPVRSLQSSRVPSSLELWEALGFELRRQEVTKP